MADRPQTRRRRQGARRGEQHPLHPPVVHRHPRAAEVVLDLRRAARRRLRGRHGLRRLLDHRLQRHRGVGHDRHARPDDVQRAALAAGGRRRRRAHVRRRPDAGAAARTRATRATCCAAPRSARRRWASTSFNVGPELEYYLFRDNRSHRGPRRGRLLRPHDARRRLRRPPRHGARARAARASTSSTPTTRSARPSTRSTCATRSALKMADDCMTYRITVKEYALKYGWHATFMPKPLFGQNGSGMHTHQSLFKDGRNAFYDAGRQVLPVRHRQGVHRRPAPPRARDLQRSSPSG